MSITVETSSSNVEIARCCVCYNIYNRTHRAPVSMPCGHTFCHGCVRRLTTENLFSCGVCRTVSPHGWTETKKSLTLIQALDQLKLLASDDIDEKLDSSPMGTNRALKDEIMNVNPKDMLYHGKCSLTALSDYLDLRYDDKQDAVQQINTAIAHLDNMLNRNTIDEAIDEVVYHFQPAQVESNSTVPPPRPADDAVEENNEESFFDELERVESTFNDSGSNENDDDASDTNDEDMPVVNDFTIGQSISRVFFNNMVYYVNHYAAQNTFTNSEVNHENATSNVSETRDYDGGIEDERATDRNRITNAFVARREHDMERRRRVRRRPVVQTIDVDLSDFGCIGIILPRV